MQVYVWLGVGIVGWLAAWLAVALLIAAGVVDPASLAARATSRHGVLRPRRRSGG